jgi:transaldolase
MKLFLDSANIEEIRQALSLGVIEGIITRPCLLPSDNAENRKLAEVICREMEGPVSFGVAAVDVEGILRDARDLMTIAPNVLVRVPVTFDGLRAMRVLQMSGIESQAIGVYSPNQALLAAKAGAAYVCPDLGRLDAAGLDGMQVAQDTVNVLRNGALRAQVLIENVEHAGHVYQAAMIGVDAAAVSLSILLDMIKHPLSSPK